jgi:glyoxylase-like metal-dependent hydrolase (beta-lactamase superfamily II)
MKKIVKRALWTAGILIGLIFAVALVFLVNFITATKAMTPSETLAINDSVWCLKEKFVNAYIFKGATGYLMVDAGFGKTAFKVEMEKLGIDPDRITTVLLTHTDGDHTGSLALYKNAAIYIHKDEEQMVNGTTGKTKFSKTKWKFKPYTLLPENDSLTIDGLGIRIIHTPGHTPGSVCFIIGNDYLVSGDNLIVVNGKYAHFIEKFNMNTPEQEASLKLLPVPASFKYILTAHYGISKIE